MSRKFSTARRPEHRTDTAPAVIRRRPGSSNSGMLYRSRGVSLSVVQTWPNLVCAGNRLPSGPDTKSPESARRTVRFCESSRMAAGSGPSKSSIRPIAYHWERVKSSGVIRGSNWLCRRCVQAAIGLSRVNRRSLSHSLTLWRASLGVVPGTVQCSIAPPPFRHRLNA